MGDVQARSWIVRRCSGAQQLSRSGPIEEGSDGVVEYSSAHLEGAESEVVIRSGHSCQSHSVTIAEVRRILLLHADTQC